MSDAQDEDGLERFFTAARAVRPVPSRDLLARVLDDAETARPSAALPVRVAPMMPRPHAASPWQAILDLLGGWRAVTGIAAAGVAGVWLGFAPPDGLDGLTGALLDGTAAAAELEQLDLLPNIDSLLGEG